MNKSINLKPPKLIRQLTVSKLLDKNGIKKFCNNKEQLQLALKQRNKLFNNSHSS